MAKHAETGKNGEEIAVQELRKKGYEILERNFRGRNAEVDIIARRPGNGELVFVEVKTRSGLQSIPEEAVGEKKQRKIVKAAELYIMEKNMEEFPLRFDVIAIRISKSKYEILHFEDAFQVTSDEQVSV